MSDITVENKPHKRFLVFAFYRYESSGGLLDMLSDFDTIDDCRDFIKKENNYDCYSIYDRIMGIETVIQL